VSDDGCGSPSGSPIPLHRANGVPGRSASSTWELAIVALFDVQLEHRTEAEAFAHQQCDQQLSPGTRQGRSSLEGCDLARREHATGANGHGGAVDTGEGRGAE